MRLIRERCNNVARGIFDGSAKACLSYIGAAGPQEPDPCGNCRKRSGGGSSLSKKLVLKRTVSETSMNQLRVITLILRYPDDLPEIVRRRRPFCLERADPLAISAYRDEPVESRFRAVL